MTIARQTLIDEPSGAPLPGMIGECQAMKEVYRLVRRAAPTDLPILIEGETGTGKELVARAIHSLGDRVNGPFVDINCAAIPDTLVESELFGSEKGAFTGATKQAGLLEVADGGTLFLDEACSLGQSAQAKLLRAIERREFRRLGGRTLVKADFRVVLALSRSTGELIADRQLRPDFAFRAAGVTVTLPPLRDRGSDVRLLAEALIAREADRYKRAIWLHEDTLDLIQRYRWPGNVRELEMLVRRLAVMGSEGSVTEAEVATLLATVTHRFRRPHPCPADIKRALEENRGVVAKSARALGISRSALYRLMQKHQKPTQ